MPSIAQQDYKIIAPKQGRSFANDAAALGELKKAVLNGIAFDCLLKNNIKDEDTLDRVLGFYRDGTLVAGYDVANNEVFQINLPYTVTQYQGLAAVQQAIDEQEGLMENLPVLLAQQVKKYLMEDDMGGFICVDNKFLITTVDGENKLTSLTMADTEPSKSDDVWVNITWEDAQKLIGLPIN